MEEKCVNTFVKSFSARPFPDEEVFPHLKLRSCISEASESLNGPRYAAQDRKTFDVYEVRYTPFEPPVSNSRRQRNAEHRGFTKIADDQVVLEVNTAWRRQEERMTQLLQAKERNLPYVCFPYSIFVFQEADGKYGVASVEDYAGLSLGDILRSGWTLVEESLLTDVLESVEAFGKLCPLLPPHGNISADAVKQNMTVREVTVEALGRSRWVVGDWLLTEPGSGGDPYEHDFESSLGDLEWMLQSTFSQFRIQSDATDDFLAPSVVESRIENMMNRLREELKQRFSHIPPIMCWANTAILDDILKPYKPAELGAEAQVERQKKTRLMTIKEKIAFHQAAQREEQQLLNRYRRRHALLPPRPHQPGELANYNALEDEGYLPSKPLRSPLQVQSSAFFSMRTDEQHHVCSSAEEEGEPSSPLNSEEAFNAVSRSEVIDDIVYLAVLYEDRVCHERKAVEEEIREQREALRNVLVRSATLATRGRRSGSSSNRNAGRALAGNSSGRGSHMGHSNGTSMAAGRDEAGGGAGFHFSHGPSYSPLLHSSSSTQQRRLIDHSTEVVSTPSGTGTFTPNPNSRRRTLTDISFSSRPQTARRTNANGPDPKGPLTPGSAVSQSGQTILFPTCGSNSNNNTNNSNKDVASLASSGKSQIAAASLSKRKETAPAGGGGVGTAASGTGSSPVSHGGMGSVNFSDSSMNHISPLPLNVLSQQSFFMGGDGGVNVPPQHSVRGGSPQSNSNADLGSSEFPAAPQSITIGEIVPTPRRATRSTARYETWTFSRSAPGMNPEGSARRNTGTGSAVVNASSTGGSNRATKFLAKKLLRSTNAGDLGGRTASSTTIGLLKSNSNATAPAKGIRSHMDPVSKTRGAKALPSVAVVTANTTGSVGVSASAASPTTPGAAMVSPSSASSQGTGPVVGRQNTVIAVPSSSSVASTVNTPRTGRAPAETLEGVTRGSIRTVTLASVGVPKTPK